MSQDSSLEDRFFELSIDLLCQLDFNGYFRRLNPAWEHTLGFTIAELMSRPFIELVHPDDRERTLAQNRDVRAGGRALGFENRYLCKDGTYFTGPKRRARAAVTRACRTGTTRRHSRHPPNRRHLHRLRN